MKELNDFEIEEVTGGRTVNVYGYWTCPESKICKYYHEKEGSGRLPGDPDSCYNCRHHCGKNKDGKELCNHAR